MDAGYAEEALCMGLEFVPACTEGAFEGKFWRDRPLGAGPGVGGELEEVFQGPA